MDFRHIEQPDLGSMQCPIQPFGYEIIVDVYYHRSHAIKEYQSAHEISSAEIMTHAMPDEFAGDFRSAVIASPSPTSYQLSHAGIFDDPLR